MAPHPRLSDIERLGLEIVPGTGGLEIQPLSAGLRDETYRVTRGGSTYALRVGLPQSFTLGLDRFWEAQVLRIAARAALAPPLLHADPARAVLLMGWIAGRSWSEQEAIRSANIRKMAALLRRIHALSVPAPARTLTPMSWVDLYTAALSRSARHPDAGLHSAAASRADQLSHLPTAEAAICHSDLHRLNLIECEDLLVLLDWEYAHVSDPLWDLAGWSANNDLDEAARHEFLTSYCGIAPTPAQRTRLELLIWLYDYVCLLWSELYLSLREDLGGRLRERATLLDARLRLPAHY